MKKQIIVQLGNFINGFSIFAIEGNNIKSDCICSADKLNKTVASMANEYNINEVVLCGNKDFANKISAEIQAVSITNYSQNLTIKIK